MNPEPTTTTTRPRRRGRVWRAAKWGGFIASLLLVVVFVLSRWWDAGISHYQGSAEDHYCRVVSIHSGSIWYLRFLNVDGDVVPGFGANLYRNYPASWDWRWKWFVDGSLNIVIVPLWIPFLLTALPTAFLFSRDRPAARRRLEGKCLACGYDLRGLAPGAVCPECGGGGGV